MNKIVISILVVIITLFTSFKNSTSEVGWIRFQYLGDISKPFPIIILYINNSIDTTYENFFTHKIKISPTEFNNIQEAIKKIKLKSEESILQDSFAVAIKRADVLEIFKTKSILETKRIFDSTMSKIQEHAIKSYFEKYKKQLGIQR